MTYDFLPILMFLGGLMVGAKNYLGATVVLGAMVILHYGPR